MRIALIRGDIDYERFLIKDKDGNLTNVDFDEVYFTVKKTTRDHAVIFQKKLTNGTITKNGLGDYQVKIESSDTDGLPYGDYVFDVQVSYLNEIKKTFVGKFAIMDEATFLENE